MTLENSSEVLTSQLTNIEEILSAITDNMPDRHFIVNENGVILSQFGNVKSQQFYELTEYQPRTIAELTTPENTEKAMSALKESLQKQELVTFETSSELSEV